MSRTTPELVPLESGDRLSRDEFHRRYCARPDIKKAELIQGVVYVSSSERYDLHDKPKTLLGSWLVMYTLHTPGIEQGGSATIFLDAGTEIQPDGFLFNNPPSWPGGVRRTDDGYLAGAPELSVEIAASSAAPSAGSEGGTPQTFNYLHDKMESYRRAGVQEYIVWQVFEKRIDWFRLREGRYVPLQPDGRGVVHSEVFPGLRLAVPQMLAGDIAAVIAEL